MLRKNYYRSLQESSQNFEIKFVILIHCGDEYVDVEHMMQKAESGQKTNNKK